MVKKELIVFKYVILYNSNEYNELGDVGIEITKNKLDIGFFFQQKFHSGSDHTLALKDILIQLTKIRLKHLGIPFNFFIQKIKNNTKLTKSIDHIILDPVVYNLFLVSLNIVLPNSIYHNVTLKEIYTKYRDDRLKSLSESFF